MKKELSIKEEVELCELVTGVEFNENYGMVYIYNADKVYKMEFNENMNVICLTENEYEEQYRFGRTMKKIAEELQRIFIEKTISEIPESSEELNGFVINNSEKIIDIDSGRNNLNDIIIRELTWKEDEIETYISKEDDTLPKTINIRQENGIYKKVYIEDGG